MTLEIKVTDRNQETKEYHRKRLADLSIKSLGKIPELDEPNQEQKQWIQRKMKGDFQ
jgi:hypothetical protein